MLLLESVAPFVRDIRAAAGWRDAFLSPTTALKRAN